MFAWMDRTSAFSLVTDTLFLHTYFTCGGLGRQIVDLPSGHQRLG